MGPKLELWPYDILWWVWCSSVAYGKHTLDFFVTFFHYGPSSGYFSMKVVFVKYTTHDYPDNRFICVTHCNSEASPELQWASCRLYIAFLHWLVILNDRLDFISQYFIYTLFCLDLSYQIPIKYMKFYNCTNKGIWIFVIISLLQSSNIVYFFVVLRSHSPNAQEVFINLNNQKIDTFCWSFRLYCFNIKQKTFYSVISGTTFTSANTYCTAVFIISPFCVLLHHEIFCSSIAVSHLFKHVFHLLNL